MINGKSFAFGPAWQAHPLCCRYALVIPDALTIRVQYGATTHDRRVVWALGVLADGQSELIGAWQQPMAEHLPWQEMLEDMSTRGVEQIRMVATNEPEPLEAMLPGVPSLPSTGQLLRLSLDRVPPRHRTHSAMLMAAVRGARSMAAAQSAVADLADSAWGVKDPSTVGRWHAALARLGPFYALAPRVRRLVLAGDDRFQERHEGARRALERHGCFSSGAQAVSFVVEALMRAERLSARRAGQGHALAA